MKLDGRFWLTKDGESFLGSGRIELLKRIETTGSINRAAKEMKMSYKAAWERVNSMNELAENPLIKRKTGGKGGGGTKLTPYAYEIIETYEKLDALHRKFIERFSEASDSPEHLAKILNRLFLTTSARNQLLCKITEIVYDNIYARVIMQLNEHQKITSTITATSMKELNLHVGDDVYAIIKSSDVLVSSRLSDFEGMSGMNILQTELMCVESNDTQSELRLKLSEKKELIAMINYEESKNMHIHNKLYVSIAYKNIIIGT